MPLTEEWKHRIERWEKILWECCYRPIDNVKLSGFITLEQLTADEALSRPFQPMSPDTRAANGNSWFKGQLILPNEADGQRIVLRLEPGGESLVWINGDIAGSVGWAHHEITLAQRGTPGDKFDILLESYAGHGLISVGKGPIRHGLN
jgi:alpha-mannosidase